MQANKRLILSGGAYMYDEFYDEPSEFDIQIEEWKDTLR